MTRRRIVVALGSALLAVVLLSGGAALWLVASESGARFLVTRIGGFLPGSFELARLEGPLRGPLVLHGLVYETETFVVRVDRAEIEWRLRQLLDRRLDVTRLRAHEVRIRSKDAEEPEEPPQLPDLNLRFHVVVRDARVEDIRIGRPGEDPMLIDFVELVTRARQGGEVDIERLTVRSELLRLEATGSVEPQGAYPVDLLLQWELRPRESERWAGAGSLEGTLEDLRIRQELETPFPAELQARLEDPLYDLRFAGDLSFSQLSAALFAPDAPEMTLAGELDVRGSVEDFAVQGRLEAATAEYGPLIARVQIDRSSRTTWRIHQAALTAPGTAASVEAAGEVETAGTEPSFDLDLMWESLSWPLREEPRLTSRRGSLELTGHLASYRARLSAELTPAAGPAGSLELAGRGDRQSFSIEELAGDVLGGSLRGRGSVVWSPETSWDLRLEARSLDPGQLAPGYEGSVGLTVASEGRLTEKGPVGMASLSDIVGTLRQRPVAGRAILRLAGERLELDPVDLGWGSAELAATGRVAPSFDLDFSLSVPELSLAEADVDGSLSARGRLAGTTDSPLVTATVSGEALRFGARRAATLTAKANLGTAAQDPLELDLRAEEVVLLEGRRLGWLEISSQGVVEEHRIRAAARDEQRTIELALAGSLAGESWEGQVRELRLATPDAGTWSLVEPAALEVSSDAARLAELCWASSGARLCAAGTWKSEGRWNVESRLEDLPFSLLSPLLPPDLSIAGTVDGEVEARAPADGPAIARADLRVGSGAFLYPAPEGQTAELPFSGGSAELETTSGGTRASLSLQLRDGGIDGRIELPGWSLEGSPAPEQPIDGRLEAVLADLGLLELFVPALEDPEGRLEARFDVAGTWSDPRLRGEAHVEDGAVELPRLGIRLDELGLSAASRGEGPLVVTGEARSGEGTLTLEGTSGAMPRPESPLRLSLTGQRFEAMDTEEALLVTNPDLELVYDGELAELTGEILLPEARVVLEEEDDELVEVSRDVVIVGREDEDREEDLELVARVRLVLGEDVEISIDGLEAEPTGSLLMIDEPGRPTRGVGELDLAGGAYTAYGQRLTIERGRLIFAGGPLDNPGLDLRAYRRAADGVVAGVEVRGRLQSPETTLWSDPPLPQSEALAYLLLGRPLDQATTGDGSLLAGAARGLGLKGGNLLAEQLGARFGLEEARIDTGAGIEEAALVLGKYLSPRLYVAYGLGLFEPVNTLRIRYILNDKLTLEAETGAGTAADLLYTRERGKGTKTPPPPETREESGKPGADAAEDG